MRMDRNHGRGAAGRKKSDSVGWRGLKTSVDDAPNLPCGLSLCTVIHWIDTFALTEPHCFDLAVKIGTQSLAAKDENGPAQRKT